MRYVSLFSGIEAASVAWRPLGWEPLAFAEIEPFPCRVLAERFPDVPNLGDVSEIDWSPYANATDVVVGGSPCQSFSIAGGRAGMDDPRGQLMLEFVRAVRDIRPWWVVWENVPGVLSQDRGRAFATLIGELQQLRYGLAWRVLDAQFYGVAQRRRRVFLVGSLGSPRACAVLFEPGCLPGGSGQSGEKRKALARAAEQRASGEGIGGVEPIAFKHFMGGKAGGVGYGEGVSPTLTDSSAHQPAVAFPWAQGGNVHDARPVEDLSPTIGAHPYNAPAVVCMGDTQSNASVDEGLAGTITRHSHKDPPVVCVNSDSRAGYDEGTCPPLRANGHTAASAYTLRMREGKPGGGKGPLISEDVSLTLATGTDQTLIREDDDGWVVRRLTPLECERLQGFPDDWTNVPGAKDGPRYKAIGNSMAVPVMRWIGERIEIVEALS